VPSRTEKRDWKSKVPRVQSLSFDQFPAPLKSAGKNFFDDNRGELPGIGQEPRVHVPVLLAQARLPPSRPREYFVLTRRCVWNLNIPELEMLVRKHPGPEL